MTGGAGAVGKAQEECRGQGIRWFISLHFDARAAESEEPPA